MVLPRLHLFELEDLAWFPTGIRDLATDYLEFMQAKFSWRRPIAALLADTLQATETTEVVDLCSGAGGPVVALARDFVADGMTVRFTLTDKYPNLPAFRRAAAALPDAISFVPEPVDAMAVPPRLAGCRTFFNSFHHFPPATARAVLQNAVAANCPVTVFEIPERSLPMLFTFLLTPLYVALATPFIRPFRWRRFVWTYLIPAVPATCWWDGIVSQLRAYTVSELESLVDGIGDGRYEWRAGRVGIPSTHGHVTYLIGRPRTNDRESSVDHVV